MAGNDLWEKYGKTFEPEDIIFCEYEPGDAVYLINDGKVKITQILKNQEKVLAILGPGDMFGEMAILEDKPRSASAIAVDSVRALAFNRDSFEDLIQRNPEIALRLIKIFSKRIHLTKRQKNNLIIKNPKTRIGDMLVLLAEKNGKTVWEREPIKLDVTPKGLAEMVSFPEDEVLKILYDYEKIRVIKIQEDSIVINDILDLYRNIKVLKEKELK